MYLRPRVDHMGASQRHRIFKKNVTPTKAGINYYVEFLSCCCYTQTGPSLVTNVTLERDYVNRVVVVSVHIYLPPYLPTSPTRSDMLLNRPCRALTVLRDLTLLSLSHS